MPGQHKPGDYPISVRLTQEERGWLIWQSAVTKKAQSRILAEAFRFYRKQVDSANSATDASRANATEPNVANSAGDNDA